MHRNNAWASLVPNWCIDAELIQYPAQARCVPTQSALAQKLQNVP